MKKNKMMRLASGLLVAVLLTTSMISGTYAKYVTTASADDTARVADWGVQITAASDVFDTSYKSTDSTYGTAKNSVEVKSGNTDNLIAPGTTKESALTFSLTGKPEVAVRVAVTLNKDTALREVLLPSGTYDDPTNAIAGDDLLVLADDYKPVLWTLKRANDATSPKTAVAGCEGVNLSVIEAYFAGVSGDYDPNTDLSTIFGYYELSWTWEYDGVNDKADTYLGNIAAGKATATDAVLNETFKLEVSATQID